MSINKVILVGFVGKEPQIRYFDRESLVAQLSLATHERGGKDRDGNPLPERTEWHNVVCYGDVARFVESHVKTGSMLYVEGKLRYRSYMDKAGIQRYITEIWAERIRFFDSYSPTKPEERKS
ncbi:MAG: single-stranded DNA-binding protein [Porphyromonas sp.]|nr:single-stranded DNA-binding protein [Porphyromonas sp.]